MSTPNDGGPAFPVHFNPCGYESGMSLRAYIATQVVAAIWTNATAFSSAIDTADSQKRDVADVIGALAIEQSDSLIKALEK